MTISGTFDRLLDLVGAGTSLSPEDLAHLETSADILELGMLADACRRRLHGDTVTYVRVATCPAGQVPAAIAPAARELRMTGTTDTLDAATVAVARARVAAGSRVVSGFAWPDLETLATRSNTSVSSVLSALRMAGLDAVGEVPIDGVGDLAMVLDLIGVAGLKPVRLTIERSAGAERVALLTRVGELQERLRCIQAVNPLPMAMRALRPTTGYADVKAVAIARLAAMNVPTIQVDWLRYGPKLAQVALTFGADDLDNVSASDEAPDGRRRGPIEEVRRNIRAAGFAPVERDGRFGVVS